MLSSVLLMLNGFVTAVCKHLLPPRLEQWDYDRHFQV